MSGVPSMLLRSRQQDIASWVCGYMDLSFGHLVGLFVITPRRCSCLLKLLDCCMNQIEQYNGDFAEVRHSMIQPLRDEFCGTSPSVSLVQLEVSSVRRRLQ
ncbi:hypothetical protein ZWY2020_029619 [Hordeum vulgare]|nr:hypothetical protein ZWY2020_029619 [Hordeum vulgare]